MAASKRFDEQATGGFVKVQRGQKPKSLKMEERMGKRFKKDQKRRQDTWE